jgi:hypothetical protein
VDATKALVELQEHDLALARLNKQLDEMPEKRAILAARGKLAELNALQARSETALSAADALVRRGEDDLRTLNERIKAEQDKLLSGAVKSPKELQAISMELDSLKRRANALEADTLSKMEKREASAGQSVKIAAAIATGEGTEARLTDRFRQLGGTLLTSIDAENRAREALLTGLPADLRARYEQIRSSRRGITVGVLKQGMCSACRVGLPAGKVEELVNGPDVGVCPNCSRLLIVRGL